MALFVSFWSFCQTNPDIGDLNSHIYYVELLSNSKDSSFQRILTLYDHHIDQNPNDIIARIEKCKFIGNSYYDEYDDYNLKYDETEECINTLYEQHPSHPKVLIYKAENLYGEEKLKLLNEAEDLIAADRLKWLNTEVAQINQMLGYYHQENEALSLQYYSKAQRLNDSLDLSLPIAEIYRSQGKDDLARKTLLSSLDKDTLVWKMNQKANLLLKLEEPEKALYLFDIIREKDSSYINNSEMAKAMTDLGNLDFAREFLVRDTVPEWGKVLAKQRLFDHDLAHSDVDTALAIYRSLQKENVYDDFFGIKRLWIFLKDPFQAWKPAEVLHLSLLYVLFLILATTPYLWVLPIYGLGILLFKSGFRVVPKLNFDWKIGHFWLLSFFYLLAQFVTIFVFEYQDTINYYFDLGSMYSESEIDRELLAKEMMLFVLFMAASTLIVLNRKNIKNVFHSNLNVVRMIGLGIVFVIFNRILIKILGLFVDIEKPNFDFNILLSAEQEILAVMSQNGFLVAALLSSLIVPVYEEIIFRGVILGSVEKYIGFKGANIFQASLFALVHDDLALFPFFFVFAIILGYWVKKSRGLLTGMVWHGIHNFMVLLGLYYLSTMF